MDRFMVSSLRGTVNKLASRVFGMLVPSWLGLAWATLVVIGAAIAGAAWMPRLKRSERVFGELATTALSDSLQMVKASTETEVSSVSISPSVRAERLRRIRAFRPKLPAHVAAAVAEEVFRLMMEVDFVSFDVDKTNLRRLFRFAGWCHSKFGVFAEVHMTDAIIEQYLDDHSWAKPSSRATYGSSLRYVRRRGARVAGASRAPAKKPFSHGDWAAFNKAAQHTDGDHRFELTLLLAMTGAAGMRSTEVGNATPDWVLVYGNKVEIRIPDKDGTFRDVPVFGSEAEAIAQAAARGGKWLFRPTFKARYNAITKLTARNAKTDSVWKSFDAVRARNYFLVRLIDADVPLPVVAAVAGVKSGSHSLSDLVDHARQPYPLEVRRWLNRARTGREDRP